jgi:hypothetical protein
MGPRAGLDVCEKSCPPPGFDPRTVQPVVSRYTDRATRPTKHIRIYANYILIIKNILIIIKTILTQKHVLVQL